MKKIQLGDTVRSYDFERIEGRPESYIEGRVMGFVRMDGCKRYAIGVTKVVAGGIDVTDERSLTRTVYPPINGTKKLFGGVCNGVEKIA